MNETTESGETNFNHLRLMFTFVHLFLVSVGLINLLVIAVIILKPYMRSITNVYMIGLCSADFMYLINLLLVAATQLNNKSWMFGSTLCTFYHGTETTGKYASVIFVVLLAADRYCAMCCTDFCTRYRNYSMALLASVIAWIFAFSAATPLYIFASVAVLRIQGINEKHQLCIARWPSPTSARWYIIFSTITIFAVPLMLIVFFYYHILKKLREALRSSKRMQRKASTRAPYHKVTRLVLWIVCFHVLCWTPFWLFNMLSSIFRLRIQTRLFRIVVNAIHLLPYVNCALNPILYAAHAENFRKAFRSLFLRRTSMIRQGPSPNVHERNKDKPLTSVIAMPFVRGNVSKKFVARKTRNHSILRLPKNCDPLLPNHKEHPEDPPDININNDDRLKVRNYRGRSNASLNGCEVDEKNRPTSYTVQKDF